jgi:hypothetical protein
LQSNGENGAVAPTGERVGGRRVENFPRLYFRERGGDALDAVDRRALNVDDRVSDRGAMPDKMFKQAGKGGEVAAYR